MQLSIMERLSLLGLLPATGDWTTLKTVRRLREACALEDLAEQQAIGFCRDGDTFRWDTAREQVRGAKEVNVSEQARCVIRGAFKDRAAAGQLTAPEHLRLATRFFGETEARTMIATALLRLNEQRKLTEGHLDLFEEYCPDLAREDSEPVTSSNGQPVESEALS